MNARTSKEALWWLVYNEYSYDLKSFMTDDVERIKELAICRYGLRKGEFIALLDEMLLMWMEIGRGETICEGLSKENAENYISQYNNLVCSYSREMSDRERDDMEEFIYGVMEDSPEHSMEVPRYETQINLNMLSGSTPEWGGSSVENIDYNLEMSRISEESRRMGMSV